MSGDPKLPIDARLSDADVKRVLERAVQIDGTQTALSVSDLTQAAREAGISETAVMQAVRELVSGFRTRQHCACRRAWWGGESSSAAVWSG